VAVIILGRDVGLGIAAIYYRWISLPPPKTFSRYWDFSLPSAEVRPTTISKYNTFLQLALVGLTTVAPVVPLDLASPLTLLQYVFAYPAPVCVLFLAFRRTSAMCCRRGARTPSSCGRLCLFLN